MLKTLIFNTFRPKDLNLRKDFRHIALRNMSTKRALVLLATGTEEMEFVIAADVLVRGGIEVTVAGVPDKCLKKCSRGVTIQPDIDLVEACKCVPFDVVVLPGGLDGSLAFAESKEVGALLKLHEEQNKIIAAICAAPTALKAHNIGFGKSITSYPSVKPALEGEYKYKEDKVVIDCNLVTSRGPATAFDFALTLVEMLAGKKKSLEVAKALLL